MPSAPQPTAQGSSKLFSPFETFSTFSRSSQDIFRARTQNALRQFDEWLYDKIGFHVWSFFLAILGIFSWLLGVVKGGVDWLLKFLI